LKQLCVRQNKNKKTMKQMNAPPGKCTEQDAVLWQKIQHFQFDNPDAALPFSRKLALLQHWDYGFTLAAIEEYRKFIFLCCISPHGAAPSKVIDEVWHLHLIYTQNYWEEFCDKTLQRKLHHHPSSGGLQQKEKHIKWEKDTLDYYRNIFQAEPPPDFWIEGQSSSPKEFNPAKNLLQKTLKYFSLLPLLLLISCNEDSLPGLIILPIGIFIFCILRFVFFFMFSILKSVSKYDTRIHNDKKQGGQGSGSSSGNSGCSGGGSSGCGSGGCGSGGCGGGCGGCGGGGG
jgi:hypothetical protein